MRTVAAFVGGIVLVFLSISLISDGFQTNFGQPIITVEAIRTANGEIEVTVRQTEWPRFPLAYLSPGETHFYNYRSGLTTKGKTNWGENLFIFAWSSNGDINIDHYYARPLGGRVDYVTWKSGGVIDYVTSQPCFKEESPRHCSSTVDESILRDANWRFDQFKTKYNIDELVAAYIRTHQ